MDTYSRECGEPNLAYFSRKQKFSTADISHIFCRSVTKFGSVRSIGVWQVLRDSGELWSTFIGTQIFDSGYLAHFLPQRGGWPIDTYFPNFVNFGLGVPRYHAATFISPSLVLVMFAFVVLSLLQYYAKRLVGKNIIRWIAVHIILPFIKPLN